MTEWSACKTRNQAVPGSSPTLTTTRLCFSVAPSPVLDPLSCHATPGRQGPLSPALRDRRGGPELD